MKICRTVQEVRIASRGVRMAGRKVGFVPTMGALHEGHLSLVRAAKKQSEVVFVSIFVNPTQFGPHEDFSKYPRTFDHDCELLQTEGVDVLFAPAVDEMYPKGAITFVTVEGLSDKLDGVSRPGHFRGVTTVVSKLFNIIEPDLAFFGQKDAAQVAIISRMVRDLKSPVEIVVCPIVREADGLAMSSRNAYLNPGERKQALVLRKSLLRAEELFRTGERRTSELVQAAQKLFAQDPSVRLDYFQIVDPDTLEAFDTISGRALVAVAAYVGNTRLIDNTILSG
ncbi:MAG: pantoate--beta-alanine ligase [Acidobacteriota bacterium]